MFSKYSRKNGTKQVARLGYGTEMFLPCDDTKIKFIN